MSVEIQTLSKTQINELISQKVAVSLTEDGLANFQRAMISTTVVWGCGVDGDIKCLAGLVPPTLLSDEAYLWLHVMEPVEEYQFVFVRHSQKMVAMALDRFPVIRGQCQVGEDRSIRWVKWLGGVFGEPEGPLIPFVIRKKFND